MHGGSRMQAHRLGQFISRWVSIPPWSFYKSGNLAMGTAGFKMEQMLEKADSVVCFWPPKCTIDCRPAKQVTDMSDTTHRESSDATLDDGCPQLQCPCCQSP